MAHGFLARAVCFANQRASWAVCLAHSLCSEGCWISLSTVRFEVTGELPETASAELVGDQDLHGLQCMRGGGHRVLVLRNALLGMSTRNNPKPCVLFDTCCHSHSLALISLFLF